jgi:hypothetical protein
MFEKLMDYVNVARRVHGAFEENNPTLHTLPQPWQIEGQFQGLHGDFPSTICEYAKSSHNL